MVMEADGEDTVQTPAVVAAPMSLGSSQGNASASASYAYLYVYDREISQSEAQLMYATFKADIGKTRGDAPVVCDPGLADAIKCCHSFHGFARPCPRAQVLDSKLTATGSRGCIASMQSTKWRSEVVRGQDPGIIASQNTTPISSAGPPSVPYHC
jgi:hypothetical protein